MWKKECQGKKESHLEKAARNYKAKIGVWCDGVHPEVPLDLEQETRREVVEGLEKVEQCGRWPQQACTTIFLDSEKCHERASHCAYACDHSLVGSFASARGCELEHKYRIEWRDTDGRKGGAERTVWGTLLEMESFNDHAEERDQGATALDLDLAKAFERVSLPVVWVWATRFSVTKKILSVLCGYFEHERRVQFARVEVELLATAHCVAGRPE